MSQLHVDGQPLLEGARRPTMHPGSPSGLRRARILTVRHRDQPEAELVEHGLEAAGYSVTVAERDADAEICLRRSPPDLVVIGPCPTGTSDVGLCARVRTYAGKTSIPIIVLAGDEDEGLRSLFAGADDFVVSPVAPIELLARAQSVLRRATPNHSGSVLRVRDIELDVERYRVTRAGRPLHLGPTEFRLLKLMMQKPGRIFSRKDILGALWGPKAKIEFRTVDICVSRLRKAVNYGAQEDAFKTVRRLGYALKADEASPK